MVDHAPWIWCESVSCWFNLPDETVTAGKGWVFPPEQDNLHIIQIDGTNLGYSFTLNKWLYLTDSGWMYMM
jgi:hypothetical protein